MRTRERTQAEWSEYWEERWRRAKELSEGRWDFILGTLAPRLQPALDKKSKGHVSCPVHGGTDGFRMMPSYVKDGRSLCNTCGNHSDGFATLMWVNGWTARETLEEVMRLLTGDKTGGVLLPRIAQMQRNTSAPEKDNEALVRSLNRVMDGCVPMTHRSAEPGRLYLARRGLRRPMIGGLLFHPRLAYHNGEEVTGFYPGIVAPVLSPTGKPITLHRTYLDEDGNKANVSCVKKLMGYPDDRVIHGAAIRLAKPGKVLGVAEGIETALAAMEGSGFPVWATVNATLMESLEIPSCVESLIVFSDKDRPTAQHPKGHGQEAARKLVQRAWEKNFKAMAITPQGEIPEGEKSLDWMDVLRVHGARGFPSLSSVRLAMLKAA